MALLVALVLWFVLHALAHTIALVLVPVIVGALTYRMPTYVIVKEGEDILFSSELPTQPPLRAKKESLWFMILLFALVAVILTILIASIVSP